MNAIINGSKWTLGYPELGTEPVAVEPFVSPEYFALEREKVFRNSWLNVGVTREIPNPGDYIVREIEITKTSLIIVRGRDNVIRGLTNVCKHRGNKLAQACNGTAKVSSAAFMAGLITRQVNSFMCRTKISSLISTRVIIHCRQWRRMFWKVSSLSILIRSRTRL